ncbi:MAG: hypothetical protein ACYC6M_05745 [Terriglobales bacterium]
MSQTLLQQTDEKLLDEMFSSTPGSEVWETRWAVLKMRTDSKNSNLILESTELSRQSAEAARALVDETRELVKQTGNMVLATWGMVAITLLAQVLSVWLIIRSHPQ